VTRTPRIPDVLGIHVRVINSGVSPAFLSFGAHRRFPIFRTALIPSGVPPKFLRRCCFPSSPPALCFIVSPSRLVYRSTRVRVRAVFSPREYYADAGDSALSARNGTPADAPDRSSLIKASYRGVDSRRADSRLSASEARRFPSRLADGPLGSAFRGKSTRDGLPPSAARIHPAEWNWRQAFYERARARLP